MTNELLAYDPQRLIALARLTREAIDHLDDTASTDPVASGAIATIRTITHRLSTTWMPLIAEIVADSSLTDWSSGGPLGIGSSQTGGGASGDYDNLTNEEFLAELDAAATATRPFVMLGPPSIPPGMFAALAARWDELDSQQQQSAIVALLALSGWSLLNDSSFLECALDGDAALTPWFVTAIVNAVASGAPVPPELQPLVDRIATEYVDELAVALHEVDDPGLLAMLGITVPLRVDTSAVIAFLAAVDPAARAAIEGRTVFDSSGFTLAGSVVAECPDGTTRHELLGSSPSSYEFYRGGGFVLGPDGRPYAIAIPTVITDDGTYTADAVAAAPGSPCVANLGGEDDGWSVVGFASGTERIIDAPNAGEMLAFAVASTGVTLSPPPPNSGLAHINMNPSGLPFFTETPPSAGQPVNGDSVDEDVPPTPANQLAANSVGVLNLAVNGAVVATSLDNQRESAYTVVFEQNEDGRRRARVVAYNVGVNPDGDMVVVPNHLFVGTDGELRQQGVSYGEPYSDETQAAYGVDEFYLSGYEFADFRVPDAVIP